MCNLMQIKYVVINDHWLGFLGVDILGSHLNAIINTLYLNSIIAFINMQMGKSRFNDCITCKIVKLACTSLGSFYL